MFETLSERLNTIFSGLTRRGSLSEKDVSEALREVRRALLEADVALDVVKTFVENVKQQAVGEKVLKSVSPGQMVIKLVSDELVKTLGQDGSDIDLKSTPPVGLLMVGLQGSGKTTTSGKLALYLTKKRKLKVLLASLDTYRPAAQDQLKILGEQTGIDTLPIVKGESPTKIAKRALNTATDQGYDLFILDTAGRTHIDEALMQEAADIKKIANPQETLLVVDSLMGQDAANLAKSFEDAVGITGVVLTRADGDGRGGAALSLRGVTGKPIKFIGMGEKLEALEAFDAKRIADRILGMGDIVALVEKAAETVDRAEAEKLAARMKKGVFTLDDMMSQLTQMQKMGGMGSILGMMPGMGAMKDKMAGAGFDDKMIKRQIAMIQSMTKVERNDPKNVLNFSRKKRITQGSGTALQDLNKLLKMHRQMADVMKMMKKQGKGGLTGKLGALLGGGGSGLGGALGGLSGMPDLKALKDIENLSANNPLDGLDESTIKQALNAEKSQTQTPSLPGLGGGASAFKGLTGLPFGKAKK